MRYPLIFGLVALLAAPATAQVSPYAGQPAREIAGLSDEDVRQLLDGAGMGYALTAELNGVPGPRHVLDLADSLHLTDAQRGRVEDAFGRMQEEARRLGAEIVRQEAELDALFASDSLPPSAVAQRTLALGELYGRLRGVHLVAHLETAAALHPPQVERYARLRGYDGSGSAGGHDAHH